MLSQTIYFSLVALAWAFSASNETYSSFQEEDFEPKEKAQHVCPWTQAQQGVHNAQMPKFSTVPPRIRTVGNNSAHIQRGVGMPNAQVPIAQVPPEVQGPNTPNFGQVPPGMQGPNSYSVQQQVFQGPIPLEQLRQIFLKGGNASVAFIVYSYVNLLNKGTIGGQTLPSNQPPSTTRPQLPGTMNGNVYPPYQNPRLQPPGTMNGNVYPPDQNPSQQFPQKTNGGGYPPNRNTWSQSPQATNQGGHGYSSYQNQHPTSYMATAPSDNK